MKEIAVLLLIALSLLSISTTVANSPSGERDGVVFKAGHPSKGEGIETAVADNVQIANLERTIEILKRHTNIKFEVAGHTEKAECSGSECENLALRRALLVYRFMLDADIDPRRVLSLSGHGFERPIDISDGSFRNQRVEIIVRAEP